VKKAGQERDFVANAKIKMQIAKCKMMGREADVWGKKVGPFHYSG